MHSTSAFKIVLICFLQALDAIKNAGPDLPKGRRKELIEEVDELTKKFVKSAEHMCKAKERELAAG